MKKTSALVLALLVGVAAMPVKATNKPSSLFDSSEILVERKNEQNTNRPRVPSATRIEAYFNDETSSVELYLTAAGETVCIALDNAHTGESGATVVPGNGLSEIPFSASAGLWTITITLENGIVYQGCFTI